MTSFWCTISAFKLGTEILPVVFIENILLLTAAVKNEKLCLTLKGSKQCKSPLLDLVLEKNSISWINEYNCAILSDKETFLFNFPNDNERLMFKQAVSDFCKRKSVFSERTDENSAAQYFHFYSLLLQQQNMLQDHIRTSTYYNAILANSPDFEGKVVLDVGAGSGILSFFAAQAGALRVYAVEASPMAVHAAKLVTANNLQSRIKVIEGKIEEIDLPELVDVIISEPVGYMLFNERMIETFLHAKKWLKNGGKMFPICGDLHVAPFTDSALYMEMVSKVSFWDQTCFYGVDLSSLKAEAAKEIFQQPVIDSFDISTCLAKSALMSTNFIHTKESDLHKIVIPLQYIILESGIVHGLAFWFDLEFSGTKKRIWLSTCPTEPLTHWYQVRCLLPTPLKVVAGQALNGSVVLQANSKQSYNITIDLCNEVTGEKSSNTLDLKNHYFRYSSAANLGYPTSSPSKELWRQIDGKILRQNPLTEHNYTACPGSSDLTTISPETDKNDTT